MIRISQDVLDDIANHAQTAAPEECCGLLIGRRDTEGAVAVTMLSPSPNVADGDRTTRFEVSPQLRFDMMRALRHTPDDIVGHYHSHPAGPAAPSETDAAQAWEPEMVWLIMALREGRPPETRGWRPDPETGGFREVALDVRL